MYLQRTDLVVQSVEMIYRVCTSPSTLRSMVATKQLWTKDVAPFGSARISGETNNISLGLEVTSAEGRETLFVPQIHQHQARMSDPEARMPEGSTGGLTGRRLSIAFTASWIVNWFLLGAKIYVFFATQSKAVLASLADSAGISCFFHHLFQCVSVQFMCHHYADSCFSQWIFCPSSSCHLLRG